ncbi:hypothetical protein K4749_17155 [Streptomyces sp. TRM72054]|nr:hypothetical protein [Streptomyces sp. TRM72054]MBX9395277.1 hypothetical protein [Streptomyces sp. TRM72054]
MGFALRPEAGFARKIVRRYDAIRTTLTTGMSNGLVESTNTKTRLIIRA